MLVDVMQSVPEEATYDSLLLPLAKVGGRLLVDVLRRNIDGTVSVAVDVGSN